MKKEAKRKLAKSSKYKEKDIKRTNKFAVFLACIIIVYIAAGIGNIFTSGNVNSAWYQSIKPSITPPNFVFPIAWNILFLLITCSLFFAWINSNKKEKKKISLLFAVNLILNILWSFLFFFLQMPAFAFFELILFWFSILFLVIGLWKISKISSWLLIPYLLWVSFASILNYLSAF